MAIAFLVVLNFWVYDTSTNIRKIKQEHRRNCERQGKYVEAEIAKNRLDELKLHEENRRKVRTSKQEGRRLIIKAWWIRTVKHTPEPKHAVTG